ncbi:MAG: 4-alpha-glucanotransferase [Chlamydiota bacterium]|jgi:4-alpha-glucanotransferase
MKHHHGVLIPLSAIHTKNSCGVGEFLDLIPFIDFCASVGFEIIQLLPLNNAPCEPSPYSCESSCALNPLYLSISYLNPNDPEILFLQSLTKTDRVEHKKIAEHKLSFLKRHYKEAPASFVKEKKWLKPYALFKALKEKFHNTPWRSWSEEYRSLTLSQIEALYPLYEQEIAFHCFLQYLCFEQLKAVKEYAHKKGCRLMGDLPILLSEESADNWQWVEFFDPSFGAGAPPDQYNPEGQNWNLPLFNWDALRKAGFPLWKQRLKYAEEFYDLFRLDHILGFFRLFAIPFGHPSCEGQYIPSDDDVALKQGENLLDMILSSTSMIPIGEDLGSVPDYVRPCLKRKGICGTKVMRWERAWETTKQCIPPSLYEPLSLCCVSTHDSEPLTLFWQTCKEEAEAICQSKGWNYTPTLSVEQRETLLRDCHHSSSLFHINPLQEYLAFFKELVHEDPFEERINVPGVVLPTNWTYRYIPSVENLIQNAPLCSKIKQLLKP